MNAQQLRNSILQQAIQGKLVPQDPADEPASVLLQRIRKEKEQLVKEGKLKKKDLESKPIEEEEIPFEIPESWEWVRLKSIVSVLGDGIHGTPEYDISGRYYFINGNNLSKNKIVIKASTGRVNEVEYQKYKKELSNRTILVSINGTIGNVGHYNGEPVILGKSACYFNLISVELKEYVTLLLYTDYFLKYAIENATGSTIKNVSLAVMKDFLLPLPPLAEQRRIVAKIEELMPLVERYGKAQQALDQLNESLPAHLRQSILQEAIQGRLVPQDPKEEPASELLKRIRKEKEQLVKEKVLKAKDASVTPLQPKEISCPIPEGWVFVRLKDVCQLSDGEKQTGSQICLDAKYLRGKKTGDILESGKFVKKGDNIILVDGENSGEVFTAPIDGYMGSTFKKLWVSSELYLPYVLYIIRSYKETLRNSKKGAAIPHLNKDIFYNIEVGIPPLSEQKRIVAKVEELFGVTDSLSLCHKTNP